jgi:hypothetical protein
MKLVTVLSIVFGSVILFASAPQGQFATESRGNPPTKQEVERSPHAEASGKSSPDEQFNVTHAEVTPDRKAAGAAEKKESTGEEKIEWGKETRGLVANLRALKTEVKSGEPIEFEIRVKNVSNKDVGLPSGQGDEKMSACFWTFYFDQWEWRSAHLSARIVFLKPGETASVRCLVATTRDSMTAEQKERRFFHAPFRHMQNKKESVRLPEGTYRVSAIMGTLDNGVKTNTIEVRISDRR